MSRSLSRNHGRPIGLAGFTLVEALASVTLTSALLVALLSISTSIGGLHRAIEDDASWRASAEDTLRCIHDELVSGWRPAAIDPARGPRVRWTSTRLEIRVWRNPRGEQPCDVVVYSLDDRMRLIRSIDGGTDPDSRHVVLGRIDSFSVGGSGDSLIVGIRSDRHGYVERAFDLPSEIVR